MSLNNLTIGSSCPDIVNVVIEISKGESRIKYEVDKDSGILVVDRFLNAPMYYPCNYGYIPCTLSDDEDALDAVVLCDNDILPGALVKCRPIGIMHMEDEGGIDDKIILVPKDKLFSSIKDIKDLESLIKDQIEHFFTHYKEIDSNKWSKVKGWSGAAQSKSLILQCSDKFQGY